MHYYVNLHQNLANSFQVTGNVLIQICDNSCRCQRS